MRRALSFDEILVRFKANTEILSKCTWNLLEKRFTKLLNETLRLQLSLDMHIDSFFTDYEALKGVLKAKSETIFNALESHAKEFIKYALNLLYQGEMYDLAISEYASESEGDDAVPFTFLQNNVEILRLPVSAEELNIDVYKDLGSLILQSESKSLYKIAHFLEDMEKGYENNTFTNRYVVTNDGVVLRLTKGLVGEGNFTVSVLDL
jgi:antirestriction protein